MRVSRRDRLAISYLPSVWIIARSVKRLRLCPRSVGSDDLAAEGRLALVRLAGRYTKKRAKFNTYAEQRVKGQMLDYIRAWKWPNRYYRDEAKALGQPITKMQRLNEEHLRTIGQTREKTPGR